MIPVLCGITPENITDLAGNEVFVFGSNLAGVHGAGAARTALRWGAKAGRGIGLSSQTYALPTKDEDIKTLSIDDIGTHVDFFHDFAAANPQLHFLVTKIGCGLAGYAPDEIAPLFSDRFLQLPNVSLPQEFIDLLSTTNQTRQIT